MSGKISTTKSKCLEREGAMASWRESCLEKSHQPQVSVSLPQMSGGGNDSSAHSYLTKVEVSVLPPGLPSAGTSDCSVAGPPPRSAAPLSRSRVAAAHASCLPFRTPSRRATSGAKLCDSSSLGTLHTKCKHFLPFGQTLAQETFLPNVNSRELK